MDTFNANNPLQPADKLTAIEPLTIVNLGLNLNRTGSATAITPLALGSTAVVETSTAPIYPSTLAITNPILSFSSLTSTAATDSLFAGSTAAPNSLQSTTLLTTPNYAIKAGGVVSFRGKSDLDGNPLDVSDDAFIYAERGFVFSGNATLPVQRDAQNAPILTNGKETLSNNAVNVATGYLVANAGVNGKTYNNLTPPQIVSKQTLTIPSFSDLQQQVLNRIPTGASQVALTVSQLGNASQWSQNFPPAGASPSQPQVVRITGGNLTIPTGINLSNYIIIVENGNINVAGNNDLT